MSSEIKYPDTKTISALKKALPTLTREGRKGQTYEYIPAKFVSDRLIEVWGLDWNCEIVGEPIIYSGHVAIKVRLHHPTETGMGFKDAFGGAKYEDAIGLGDTCKKAASLALKKAASLVGIDLQDEESTPITDEQKQLIAECFNRLGQSPSKTQLEVISSMSSIVADEAIAGLMEQIKAAS